MFTVHGILLSEMISILFSYKNGYVKDMFALVFGFAYHCRYKYHKFLPTQEYHLIIFLKNIYSSSKSTHHVDRYRMDWY